MIHTIVKSIAIVIVISVILFLTGLGWVVTRSVGEVQSVANTIQHLGLKSYVDKLWCGEKGCDNKNER